MKHSQLIGILCCLGVIATCFMPWSTLPARHIVIKGLSAVGTDFGKPGFVNVFMCAFMILWFSLPKIAAKRANLFFGTVNFAWSCRNFILVSSCYIGECPEKQIGLYLLVGISAVALLMTLLPKMELKPED